MRQTELNIIFVCTYSCQVPKQATYLYFIRVLTPFKTGQP